MDKIRCSNCQGRGFVVDDGDLIELGIKDYGEHQCSKCNGSGKEQ